MLIYQRYERKMKGLNSEKGELLGGIVADLVDMMSFHQEIECGIKELQELLLEDLEE